MCTIAQVFRGNSPSFKVVQPFLSCIVEFPRSPSLVLRSSSTDDSFMSRMKRVGLSTPMPNSRSGRVEPMASKLVPCASTKNSSVRSVPRHTNVSLLLNRIVPMVRSLPPSLLGHSPTKSGGTFDPPSWSVCPTVSCACGKKH